MKKLISKLVMISICFATACAFAEECDSKTNQLSVDDEILLGCFVDAYIANRFIIVEDYPALDRLNKIGQDIASSSDRPNLQYTFKILKSDDINAFAVPGGYVYITTALLDILETEDEIAVILGHEIAHICQRHPIRALQNVENKSIPGSSAFLSLSEVTVNTEDTKAYEYKADELGMIYMKKAGYNPGKVTDVLTKLLEIKRNKKPDVEYTLLITHPPLEDRIEQAKEVAARLETKRLARFFNK